MSQRMRLPLFLASVTLAAVALPLGGAGVAAAAPVVPAFTSSSAGVGNGPLRVVVTDVNGDGRADIVTANILAAPKSVSVLLGKAGGGFTALPDIALPAGANPEALAVGDVNGDSAPDIVVAEDNSPGTVSVILGVPTGGFGAATDYAAGKNPVSVALLGTGKVKDLVVADGDSGHYSLLTGSTAGTFGAPTTLALSAAPAAVAVGDVNKDGIQDLLFTLPTAGMVAVLPGQAAGFGTERDVPAGTMPSSLAVADLNNDKNPDVVVVNAGTTGTLSSLLGKGDGTFGLPTPVTPGNLSGPEGLVLADVTGDGIPDAVVAESSGDEVSEFPGKGDGTFGARAIGNLPSMSDAQDVGVGDVNGDGRLDIVAPDYPQPGSTVTVLTQSTPPVDHLALTASAPTTPAGKAVTITAQGLDGNSKPLGDVTSGTAFTIAPDGSCSTNVCTPAAEGVHTVTGSDGGKTGTVTITATAAGTGAGTGTSPSGVVTLVAKVFVPIGAYVTYTATVKTTAGAPVAGAIVSFAETYTDGRSGPIGQVVTGDNGLATLRLRPLYNGTVTAYAVGAAAAVPSRVFVTYRAIGARQSSPMVARVHAETRPGFIATPARQERAQILLVDAHGRQLGVLALVNAAQRRIFPGEAQGTNAIDATIVLRTPGTYHLRVRVLGTPVNTGAPSPVITLVMR